MKIISHRANLNGRNPEKENHPESIESALREGFDVEIDVWFLNGNYFLGHDHPNYLVSDSWLANPSFWCHAKNVEALECMMDSDIHCFWHENDRFTITSKGIPWCYPNNYHKDGIVVTGKLSLPPKSIFGICTDYPLTFRDLLSHSA
jgi:hypothetical protein